MRFFDNCCIERNLACERSYKTERSTSILNDLKLLKGKKQSISPCLQSEMDCFHEITINRLKPTVIDQLNAVDGNVLINVTVSSAP